MRIERRKHLRYGFQSEVELLTASTVLRGLVTDIGLGGMFVVVSTPFPIGTEFTARLLLDPPLFLSCTVRRVLPSRGMGVSFEQLPEEACARLEELIVHLSR